MSPGVRRHCQGESSGRLLYNNFRVFRLLGCEPLDDRVLLSLLSISTAGIWSLAPSPGPRFLQGAPHAMMRTQHFRIQNEPCSMPYVLMVHWIQIYVLLPQCHISVLLLKQLSDCLSFQICIRISLQIYVLSLFIVVFLIFKRYPWVTFQMQQHKFL